MINTYEVELVVRKRPNGAERLVTRKEHAYGVMDAFMLATVNHVGAEPGDEVIRVLRIGPPAELILRDTASVGRAVELALDAIGRAK